MKTDIFKREAYKKLLIEITTLVRHEHERLENAKAELNALMSEVNGCSLMGHVIELDDDLQVQLATVSKVDKVRRAGQNSHNFG